MVSNFTCLVTLVNIYIFFLLLVLYLIKKLKPCALTALNLYFTRGAEASKSVDNERKAISMHGKVLILSIDAKIFQLPRRLSWEQHSLILLYI